MLAMVKNTHCVSYFGEISSGYIAYLLMVSDDKVSMDCQRQGLLEWEEAESFAGCHTIWAIHIPALKRLGRNKRGQHWRSGREGSGEAVREGGKGLRREALGKGKAEATRRLRFRSVLRTASCEAGFGFGLGFSAGALPSSPLEGRTVTGGRLKRERKPAAGDRRDRESCRAAFGTGCFGLLCGIGRGRGEGPRSASMKPVRGGSFPRAQYPSGS
jgi:hypothetical protein